MKFFVDTADLEEIRDLAATGLLDGVTTNPTLVAKSGRDFRELIAEICALVPGPVSAEVAATAFEPMLAEGRALARLAPNVAVKVPLTPAGLKVCHRLSGDGVLVNVTLCFSAAQALLAAKAGAAFISPFVGRLDDVGQDGAALLADIVDIYSRHDALKTEVLAASIRGPGHVIAAARAGAHVVTMPPSVLRQLYRHPLTDQGLSAFLADWERPGSPSCTRRPRQPPRADGGGPSATVPGGGGCRVAAPSGGIERCRGTPISFRRSRFKADAASTGSQAAVSG